MAARIRLLVAALAATVVFGVTTTAACAGNFQVSENRFKAVWTTLTSRLGEVAVSCAVTLEGSFHSRTFSKVSGLLVGYVSRATASSCTGGTETVLQETLPWHLRYVSYEGTLPTLISGVGFSLVGAGMRIAPAGWPTCLALTTASQPLGLTANVSSGRVTSLRPDEASAIETPCFLRAQFAGTTSSVVATGSGTAVSIQSGPTGVLQAQAIVIRPERTFESGMVTNTDNSYLASVPNTGIDEPGGKFSVTLTGCENVPATGSCTATARLVGRRGESGTVSVEYLIGGVRGTLVISISS